MLHRVVVPFPCSWDGITAVSLVEGDCRDFGAMADGLVAVGWIVPWDDEPEEFAVAEEPIEMAVTDEPIEMAVVRRGRKRK